MANSPAPKKRRSSLVKSIVVDPRESGDRTATQAGRPRRLPFDTCASCGGHISSRGGGNFCTTCVNRAKKNGNSEPYPRPNLEHPGLIGLAHEYHEGLTRLYQHPVFGIDSLDRLTTGQPNLSNELRANVQDLNEHYGKLITHIGAGGSEKTFVSPAQQRADDKAQAREATRVSGNARRAAAARTKRAAKKTAQIEESKRSYIESEESQGRVRLPLTRREQQILRGQRKRGEPRMLEGFVTSGTLDITGQAGEAAPVGKVAGTKRRKPSERQKALSGTTTLGQKEISESLANETLHENQPDTDSSIFKMKVGTPVVNKVHGLGLYLGEHPERDMHALIWYKKDNVSSVLPVAKVENWGKIHKVVTEPGFAKSEAHKDTLRAYKEYTDAGGRVG